MPASSHARFAMSLASMNVTTHHMWNCPLYSQGKVPIPSFTTCRGMQGKSLIFIGPIADSPKITPETCTQKAAALSHL